MGSQLSIVSRLTDCQSCNQGQSGCFDSQDTLSQSDNLPTMLPGKLDFLLGEPPFGTDGQQGRGLLISLEFSNREAAGMGYQPI